MLNASLYLDEKEKKAIILNQKAFVIEIYRRAYFIKHFEKIEVHLSKIANKEINYDPNDELIYEMIYHKITDYVHFIIFFENFLKSELISKGVCVHSINKKIPLLKKNK